MKRIYLSIRTICVSFFISALLFSGLVYGQDEARTEGQRKVESLIREANRIMEDQGLGQYWQFWIDWDKHRLRGRLQNPYNLEYDHFQVHPGSLDPVRVIGEKIQLHCTFLHHCITMADGLETNDVIMEFPEAGTRDEIASLLQSIIDIAHDELPEFEYPSDLARGIDEIIEDWPNTFYALKEGGRSEGTARVYKCKINLEGFNEGEIWDVDMDDHYLTKIDYLGPEFYHKDEAMAELERIKDKLDGFESVHVAELEFEESHYTLGGADARIFHIRASDDSESAFRRMSLDFYAEKHNGMYRIRFHLSKRR